MPIFRHVDRGTVIETVADPGYGWELADSPRAEDQAEPPKKKAAPKKAATSKE